MSNPNKNHKDIEFPDFIFDTFGSMGRCYIKVRQRPEDFVVFCAQLTPYRGTSITNAIDNIFRALVARLRSEGIAVPRRLDKIIERFSWIEHYPRSSGLVYGDTHAIVRFDCKLNPIWCFVTKKDAAFTCNVPQSFLRVTRTKRASGP